MWREIINENMSLFQARRILQGAFAVVSRKVNAVVIPPPKETGQGGVFTGGNFEKWLCVQNPISSDANVVITYFNTSGVPIAKPHLVPANSRYTVNVNTDAGAGLKMSARVNNSCLL